MTRKYRRYLKSYEWAQLKADLYKVRSRKCERCGNKTRLQVHHKTYDNIYKEKHSDLEILCDTCHKKEHGIAETKKRKSKIKGKAKIKAAITRKKMSADRKNQKQALDSDKLKFIYH